MQKTKKHWIIPDAWSTGYKSLCGSFGVSIFHHYGISHITDEIVHYGAVTPKEITCKKCGMYVKSQKEMNIKWNEYMMASFCKHRGE